MESTIFCVLLFVYSIVALGREGYFVFLCLWGKSAVLGFCLFSENELRVGSMMREDFEELGEKKEYDKIYLDVKIT